MERFCRILPKAVSVFVGAVYLINVKIY